MYIENFKMNLWHTHQIDWDEIHKDVNILVGINGAGKTTLLNGIYDYYTKFQYTSHKLSASATSIACGNWTEIPITYIRSFDVPSNVKKGAASPLMQSLTNVVYQNNIRSSFFDYRMRALNYREEADRVLKRIDHLFFIVNQFFKETHKEIEFDKENNKLVFRKADGKIISLEMLSAGEKQLMLILLTVFLMDEKPNVLLLDEPELSLHIEWQGKLIKCLRELNAFCQMIITTHSPSVFASGWQDRLVFIDEITTKQ